MSNSKIIKEIKKDNYKNMNNIKHSRACRRLHQLIKANQGVIRRKSISEMRYTFKCTDNSTSLC